MQNAAFQKQRRWEEMQKLRGEAKVWLTELDNREHVYRRALQALVGRRTRSTRTRRPNSSPARWNPFRLEPHRADQFRRHLRADGHRAVPDAGALHAAGGLGRRRPSCASS